MLGYDTDSIAMFEIDKSFTDFLLCQICYSKLPVRCTKLGEGDASPDLAPIIFLVEMSRDAKECDYCNKLFCKLCIENWLILNKNCPVCLKDIKIRGASRVVKEIIHCFQSQCQFCSKLFMLSEIDKHEP